MIEIEGLTKVYPDGTQALAGLDLEIGGGIFGLLGPNGAGKTTFLSLLVLELAPTSGRLRFDGLDAALSAHRPTIRRRLGYLPQEYSPVTRLTGREYLLYCARLRLVDMGRRALAGRVDQLLEAVGLAAAADRRSGEYSGGMKRRLGIAQALVHAPAVVVVDEPTAGLDPEERMAFRHLISEVANGRTVVLCTHIVEDLEASCQRIGVISGGRLAFQGSPAELTAAVDGQLWELPADVGAPPGSTPVGRRAAGVGEAVDVVFSPQPVTGARPHRATLEDAYAVFLADERRHPVASSSAA